MMSYHSLNLQQNYRSIFWENKIKLTTEQDENWQQRRRGEEKRKEHQLHKLITFLGEKMYAGGYLLSLFVESTRY